MAIDPEVVLQRIYEETALISANVEYDKGIIIDLNQTLTNLNSVTTQMHGWLQYSSCIQFMTFATLILVSMIFVYNYGKLRIR